ncbi:hypothetical protein NDU88_009315 [Pleurodeles waltl]|uniref:Uncharacterized protein n=1 Tax=Pleurodeles waltl TaxID=8319 RepID=A0AAV7PRS1_PLEWA|nr:hypothetical protein NDU88_009315 [Pleurodeles waltl]
MPRLSGERRGPEAQWRHVSRPCALPADAAWLHQSNPALDASEEQGPGGTVRGRAVLREETGPSDAGSSRQALHQLATVSDADLGGSGGPG